MTVFIEIEPIITLARGERLVLGKVRYEVSDLVAGNEKDMVFSPVRLQPTNPMSLLPMSRWASYIELMVTVCDGNRPQPTPIPTIIEDEKTDAKD